MDRGIDSRLYKNSKLEYKIEKNQRIKHHKIKMVKNVKNQVNG